MLVLSRKLNEQIVVSWGKQTALVRVVEKCRGRVRLGVTAPIGVAVHREEIAERIQEWEAAHQDAEQPNDDVAQQVGGVAQSELKRGDCSHGRTRHSPAHLRARQGPDSRDAGGPRRRTRSGVHILHEATSPGGGA